MFDGETDFVKDGDSHLFQLYAYTNIGTKDLISEYIEEVVTQLNWICDEPSTVMEDGKTFDLKSKYEFFLNIRQSFGRTSLLLSGGGTLGTILGPCMCILILLNLLTPFKYTRLEPHWCRKMFIRGQASATYYFRRI
jgi:hypothetical protein